MNRKRLLIGVGAVCALIAIGAVYNATRKGNFKSGSDQNQAAADPDKGNRIPEPATVSPAQDAPPTAAGGVAKESAVLAAASLSLQVVTAIGRGDRQDFGRRLEAVVQMSKELSAAERQALYEYLRDNRAEPWLRPEQAFALKNDILNRLREQELPPDELTDFMLALRQDSTQPLVMRDYALQHLASWYSNVEDQQRRRIIAELQTAAEEIDQSYAGTALLGLHRIQERHPAESLPAITDQILHLTENDSANLLARITAIQLAGQLKLNAAGEAVHRIASAGSQPPTLRIAAVAALGSFDRLDIDDFLDATAEGEDSRLRIAASIAQKRRTGLTRN